MNIGIICNIMSNEPEAVVGVNYEDKLVGYITNNEDLDDAIEFIVNHRHLELLIQEEVDGKIIVREEKVDMSNPNYLVALNYNLPYPWRLLGVTHVDGDLESIVQESYDYIMGGLQNE